MDEADRERLLARVRRSGSTIGATIPETIKVGGSPFPLKEFIFHTRDIEELGPEVTADCKAAKRALGEAREERYERLQTEDLTLETAEQLADEIDGIDRAVNALDTIRHPPYAEDAAKQSIKDHKRWLSFLDEIK
jgi:hypothetical protein